MRLLLLLLLKTALSLQDDGYYCRSCTLFMETMQVVVADETRRMSEGYKGSGFGASKNKHFGHIDLMHIVESMCRREEFRDLYEEDIQEACEMLSKDNAIPISYLFTGEPPSTSLAYKRTVELCVKKLDVCEEDKNLEETFKKITRKDRDCWLCHMISRDFVSTLQRYRNTNRKTVFSALDDLCSRIAIRYPKLIGSKLEEKCDELVEEDDKVSDIADVVILRQNNDEELVQLLQKELLCTDSCHRTSSDNDEQHAKEWWWFRKGNQEVSKINDNDSGAHRSSSANEL